MTGADTLNGGAGRDTLTGGAQADKFIFNVAATAANADTITDFKHGLDKIQLDNAVFKGLSDGALAGTKFFVGVNAHDADDRIIYNSANGQLFFDSDGSGAHAKVLIATLTGHPALSAADIQII